MGGKSELVTTSSNHVPAPTQEQLRIAHITQDNTMNDGEKAALLKMTRQVMEATKCSQFTAEIALYDSGNNVEEAVLAIIERNDEQDTWTNSKNRKTKKAEKAQEEKENFVVEKPVKIFIRQKIRPGWELNPPTYGFQCRCFPNRPS